MQNAAFDLPPNFSKGPAPFGVFPQIIHIDGVSWRVPLGGGPSSSSWAESERSKSGKKANRPSRVGRRGLGNLHNETVVVCASSGINYPLIRFTPLPYYDKLTLLLLLFLR